MISTAKEPASDLQIEFEVNFAVRTDQRSSHHRNRSHTETIPSLPFRLRYGNDTTVTTYRVKSAWFTLSRRYSVIAEGKLSGLSNTGYISRMCVQKPPLVLFSQLLYMRRFIVFLDGRCYRKCSVQHVFTAYSPVERNYCTLGHTPRAAPDIRIYLLRVQ